MHPDLKNVHHEMKSLGLAALAHANWHAHIISTENDKWSELSVLQAAHAGEILIKARIAEEHPLLIFDKIPGSTQVDSSELDFRSLIKKARTIQYYELVDRLWAVTGIKIAEAELFKSFGELRNSIQHFAIPESFDFDATDFIFKVIDPFINECWGLFAIDYTEDYEPYIYLIDSLIRNETEFLVSPGCIDVLPGLTFEWPSCNYRRKMIERFNQAGYNGDNL